MCVEMFNSPDRPSDSSLYSNSPTIWNLTLRLSFIKRYFNQPEGLETQSKEDQAIKNEYIKIMKENQQMRRELKKLELQVTSTLRHVFVSPYFSADQKEKYLAIRASKKLKKK